MAEVEERWRFFPTPSFMASTERSKEVVSLVLSFCCFPGSLCILATGQGGARGATTSRKDSGREPEKVCIYIAQFTTKL